MFAEHHFGAQTAVGLVVGLAAVAVVRRGGRSGVVASSGAVAPTEGGRDATVASASAARR